VIFSKFKGHNFAQNKWIKAKFKINLYLGIAKQCNKYQLNICKQSEKKVWKTDNSWFFQSPSAITSWKINGSEPNSNFICMYESHQLNSIILFILFSFWIVRVKCLRLKIRPFPPQPPFNSFLQTCSVLKSQSFVYYDGNVARWRL
jgi:hypothetical protein